MKRKGFILTALVFFTILAMGAYFETRHQGWIPLRTAVTADDTALDGTTSGYTYRFTDKPAAAKAIPTEWNILEVYFYGTDAANETCNYKIYVWKDTGPARLVASGVVTLGTAVTGATTTFYADTITNTSASSTWPTTVAISDSGNNRVSSIVFDACGYKWIYAEFDIPSSAQVASISAEITGY